MNKAFIHCPVCCRKVAERTGNDVTICHGGRCSKAVAPCCTQCSCGAWVEMMAVGESYQDAAKRKAVLK